MKQILALLTTILLLLSCASAEELNYLWDIPIGVTMEEALQQFTDATSFQLKESEKEKYNGRDYVGFNIPIQSTTYNISFSGIKIDENAPLTFNGINIDTMMIAETEDEIKLSIQYLNELHHMITSIFGQETAKAILVDDGPVNKYSFYENPNDESFYDLCQSVLNEFGSVYITFEWKNVRMVYTYILDVACIYVYESDNARSHLSASFNIDQGMYQIKPSAITSF